MNDISLYIASLRANAETFQSLFNVPVEHIKWKQKAEQWNLLEIACHLHDEEREDFRMRLKLVLESPGKPFPPIDPAGWVHSRRYDMQDFKTIVKKFIEERTISISWLLSLQNPDWGNIYVHPKIGPMSAKFILANWVAHDYLHIRQIARIKYDYLKWFSEEDLSYAGNW